MKKALFIIVAIASILSVSAQKRITMKTSADEVVTLWDNTTARYSNMEEKDEELRAGRKFFHTSYTDLYIFTAPKEIATGYSVVIYPGGGYTNVSVSTHFAEWCRENGITAVILKYRLPNYGHADAMLEDATGAIDYMRQNAEKYNLDPAKLGVCGNSAGGHLAAWVSNLLEDEKKPYFTILACCSVLRDAYYMKRSANMQLGGKNITAEQAENLTIPNLVGKTTPPAMILLCDDDVVVQPLSSIEYYKRLKYFGIPASLHIYPEGGHSWIGNREWKYREQWTGAVKDWLMNLEEYKNRTKN